MTRVADLWSRGRFYARAGARLSVWAILLWLLILLLQRFEAAMVSRLGHLGEAELRRADWPCSGPQCDFSTFWPAGWLARAHRVAEIYDPAALARFQHEIFLPRPGLTLGFTRRRLCFR